jgi:hypothetical protein
MGKSATCSGGGLDNIRDNIRDNIHTGTMSS